MLLLSGNLWEKNINISLEMRWPRRCSIASILTRNAYMNKRSNGRGLILFVHGLAGSRFGTWGNMLKILSADEEFREYIVDCYSFPTSLIRLPFLGRRAGIRELSDGLNTYIKSYYSDQENIILVGHSLGGVIARFYVLEQVKAKTASAIKGIALYAVPNTGAGIAIVANAISWRHRHLRQLCTGSDFLEELNVEWIRQNVESKIQTLYIVGGADAVVSRESGLAYIGTKNTRTIVEHGHRAIVKPNNINDIRYIVLKDFALSIFNNVGNGEKRWAPQNAKNNWADDPLFDVYSVSVEKYYVIREADRILKAAAASAHLWVSGPSGVGKTAAVKRLIDQSGWRFQHIMLASLQGLAPQDLFREICSFLYERAGIEENPLTANDGITTILKHIRAVIPNLPGEGNLAIFVEEIPLPLGPEYSNFLDTVYHIALDVETLDLPFRVTWIFSSIKDPKSHIRSNRSKFLEKVQFIDLAFWRYDETKSLLDLILAYLPINLTQNEQEQLIISSGGSPRYIKIALRRRRTEVGENMSVIELLRSVAADLNPNE